MRLRASELTWQELDGYIVVLDLKAGVYLELNSSGTVLFPLLVDGAAEDELVQALRSTFDLPLDTATRDVRAFIADLERRHLLDQ